MYPISLSDIDHKNHEYNIETSLDFSSPLPEPEPEPIRSSLKENTETVEMNRKVYIRLTIIIIFKKMLLRFNDNTIRYKVLLKSYFG